MRKGVFTGELVKGLWGFDFTFHPTRQVRLFPYYHKRKTQRQMNSANSRQRSQYGKDNGGGATNEDLEILRKEYRNMQANRNAFAHESDMVSLFFLPMVRCDAYPPLQTLTIPNNISLPLLMIIGSTEAAGHT